MFYRWIDLCKINIFVKITNDGASLMQKSGHGLINRNHQNILCNDLNFICLSVHMLRNQTPVQTDKVLGRSLTLAMDTNSFHLQIS